MNKLHLHKIIATLIAIIAGSTANAQIGVTLVNNTQTDVNLGDKVIIYAEVRNFGNNQFAGVLDFGLRSNLQVLTQTNLFAKPNYSGNTIVLGPGEVVPATFSVDVDPQYFTPGPDGIVIWPISGQNISDSILLPIQVLAPAAINNTAPAGFKMFCYAGQLHVLNANPDNAVKQVRIYGLLGEEIVVTNGEVSAIDLQQLPVGIYLAEALLADDRRVVIKFLR